MLYILRRVALPITGRPWDGVYTASSGKSVWRAEDTHLARAEHHLWLLVRHCGMMPQRLPKLAQNRSPGVLTLSDPPAKNTYTCAKVVDVWISTTLSGYLENFLITIRISLIIL